MNIQTKALATSIDDKNYTLKCIMSAEVVDRHGEIVDIDTMDIKDFIENPVVLPFHQYDKLSVGKVLEITKTTNEQGIKVMECTIQFAVEEYEVAKTYFNLYKGGYMSAFSIGFQVGAVEQDAQSGQTRLLNCKLLEISCVSVPANQLALAKAKGVDIEAVKNHIPKEILIKEVREFLIDIKSLIEETKDTEKQTEETTETDTEIDKDKKGDILKEKEEDTLESKKLRAKTILERAIRTLK